MTEPEPVTTAPPAAHRGRLTISERAVSKIASQAAAEIAEAGGYRGGVLGFGAGADLTARPKVDVTLAADSVDIELEMAAAYPTSIRQATALVREHVTHRVEALTGIAVHRVDIDVTALTGAGRNQPARRPLR